MGAVAKISLEDQWQGKLGGGEQNPSFVFQAEVNPPPSPRLEANLDHSVERGGLLLRPRLATVRPLAHTQSE